MSLTSLAADARRQLDAPLALLALALGRLKRIESPARRDLTPTTVRTVATPGGPVQPPVAAGEEPTPGSGAAPCGAVTKSGWAVVGLDAGADFLLPSAPGVRPFDRYVLGRGPQYDALPQRT